MGSWQQRNETDDFLNRAPGSSTFIPDAVGNIPTNIPGFSIPQALLDAMQREDAALTGAIQPLLPMTISILGRDGVRTQITLLINPENMNHGKTNANHAAYTRKGWILQHWGPNQDLITATGKSAVFMVPGEGTAEILKSYSFAFLNFMSLVVGYKNNGYVMLDKTKPLEDTRVIDMVTGVEISYDDQCFMGHFNNFTLDESADSPFIFNYNFEFVCSALSTNYNFIRGHFIPISKWKDPTSDQTYPSTDNAQGQQPPTSTTLYDVSSNGATYSAAPAKTKSDASAQDVWAKLSKQANPPNGYPWSEAIRRHFTNGSYNGNMALRAQLLKQGVAFFAGF